MTRAEKAHAESLGSSSAFRYPDDEPTPFNEGEVYKKALEFAMTLVGKSRTPAAARLRLTCAWYVVLKAEKPAVLCKKLKVSRRRFFEVCQEIRQQCGLS